MGAWHPINHLYIVTGYPSVLYRRHRILFPCLRNSDFSAIAFPGNSTILRVQKLFLPYRVSTFLISGAFRPLRNCTIIFRPKLYLRFNSIDPAGSGSFYMLSFLVGCFYGLSTVGLGMFPVVKKVKRRIWFFYSCFFLLFGGGEPYLENAQKKVFWFWISLNSFLAESAEKLLFVFILHCSCTYCYCTSLGVRRPTCSLYTCTRYDVFPSGSSSSFLFLWPESPLH